MWVVVAAFAATAAVACLLAWRYTVRAYHKRRGSAAPDTVTIGVFHPYWCVARDSSRFKARGRHTAGGLDWLGGL